MVCMTDCDSVSGGFDSPRSPSENASKGLHHMEIVIWVQIPANRRKVGRRLTVGHVNRLFNSRLLGSGAGHKLASKTDCAGFDSLMARCQKFNLTECGQTNCCGVRQRAKDRLTTSCLGVHCKLQRMRERVHNGPVVIMGALLLCTQRVRVRFPVGPFCVVQLSPKV